MKHVEDFMNTLSDVDWLWWPVLFLRPQKNKDIDNLLLLKISCFGGPATSCVSFLLSLPCVITMSATDIAYYILYCVVASNVIFYFVYKYTFTLFWNRRARRLRNAQTEYKPAS